MATHTLGGVDLDVVSHSRTGLHTVEHRDPPAPFFERSLQRGVDYQNAPWSGIREISG